MVLAVVRDITERKLAEEQENMRAELQQKELLVREVHHRVKNNLQVISSILALEQLMVPDPEIAGRFENTQTRVNAMALMHDKLFRSASTEGSVLQFDEYLADLVRDLALSHNIQARGVTLDLRSQPVRMSIDQAVPCGLIVNELVTNALKHAFPKERRGGVHVSLQEQDGQAELEVADDGVGLAASDQDTSSGLGLQIIKNLARQLQARYETVHDGGTKTVIAFTIAPPNRNREATS
jgi:two-component sensor histidine kinase